MIIKNTGQGLTTSDTNTFKEVAWTFFEANGTIAVGSPVIHDHSTDDNAFNVDGLLVVEGTSASQVGAAQRILGTYTGMLAAKNEVAGGYSLETVNGLTTDGSATISTIVLSGYAAFNGDVIRVLSYGQGYVLAHGGTTDINCGDNLTIATIGGRYEAATNMTTGAQTPVAPLGKHTGNFEAGVSAFHRCL